MSETIIAVIIGGAIAALAGFITSWWTERRELNRWKREQRLDFLIRRTKDLSVLLAQVTESQSKWGEFAVLIQTGQDIEKGRTLDVSSFYLSYSAIMYQLIATGIPEMEDILINLDEPIQAVQREITVPAVNKAMIEAANIISKYIATYNYEIDLLSNNWK